MIRSRAMPSLPTAVTGYEIGLFIHVAAVIVALGGPFAYPFFTAIAESSDPRSVPTVLRALRRNDFAVVTPGMVILLLAGIYLLADASISLGESWVSAGLLAIILLFAVVHGVIEPAVKKAIGVAERDLGQGDELSEEYRALSRRMNNAGILAGLIVIVAAFFMVVKP
jgi:uncharacterized membrane protein